MITHTVNLIADPHAAKRTDVQELSHRFPLLMGTRISWLLYMDSASAKLGFSDGSSLLFPGDQAEQKQPFVRMQLSGPRNETLPAADAPTDGFFISDGIVYSAGMTLFLSEIPVDPAKIGYDSVSLKIPLSLI